MRLKKYLTLCLFLAGTIHCVNTTAQDMEIIHLWEQVPGETGPKEPHVLSGDTSRSVTRIARVTDPVLHVYRPSPGKTRNAGIIVCPGGGYSILAIDLEGHEIAQWLTGLGYTAFVLEYRVPKKRLNALQDLQRAIRIVRSRSDEWNLESGKIGAIGFSAGANLIARAGSSSGEKLYEYQDEADSVSAKPSFSLLVYPAYLDQGENHTITPELKIDSDHPPVFLFGTADDKHGNSVLLMAGALRDAGADVEAHLYAEGGHGYGLRKGNPAAEAWPVLAESWLGKITGESQEE